LIQIMVPALGQVQKAGRGVTHKGFNVMSKPIPDKAEVALEYPDKLYIGTFERSARFEAHLDATGIALLLDRPGDAAAHKSVRLHLNYGLFADILRDLADAVSSATPDNATHREDLRDAAEALSDALAAAAGGGCVRGRHRDSEESEGDTPEEEVLLLHVME
jgi:hypothetical protein